MQEEQTASPFLAPSRYPADARLLALVIARWCEVQPAGGIRRRALETLLSRVAPIHAGKDTP